MASPQLEKGYTQICNEILERLSFAGINGSDYRILLVVIRKTYGFQKKKDMISLTQFQKATQMDRKQVVETIKSLVGKRILLKDKNTYIFNKNWEEWVVGKRTPSGQKHTGGSGQKTTKSSGQKHTHKRKKEIETKERKFAPLGAEIIKAFEVIDPKNRTYYNHTTQRSACDYLLEEFGLDVVLKRISVLPQTNKMPYFPTITNPYELKEKWQKLEDAVERKQSELKAKERNIIL